MKKAIVFFLILAVTVACDSGPTPQQQAAQRNVDDLLQNDMAEHTRRMREIQLEAWGLRYGEQTATKLYECTDDPPKQPANQKWCKQWLARAAKDDAADDAQQKRDEAAW